MVLDAPWPVFDPALAADDEVVLPIQVNGKRRGEIRVARGLEPAEVEAIVMADADVQARLEGQTVRKIVVVKDRIVNLGSAERPRHRSVSIMGLSPGPRPLHMRRILRSRIAFSTQYHRLGYRVREQMEDRSAATVAGLCSVCRRAGTSPAWSAGSTTPPPSIRRAAPGHDPSQWRGPISCRDRHHHLCAADQPYAPFPPAGRL